MNPTVGREAVEAEMQFGNLVGRIRKLRWMGLEEDAATLETRLYDVTAEYVILDEPMETD